MKILHVITGLGQGGSEGVLFRLIAASPPDIDHVVVSLMGEAYFGPLLRKRGVTVFALEEPPGQMSLRGVLKLRRLVAAAHPDVVQTWMYHADLVGGLVARWAGIRSVIWGIRNSSLDADKASFTARAVARTCALLSRIVPSRIVCCSVEAAEAHQRIGYQARKFSVIPNGYDLSRFAPDAEARTRLRQELGIEPQEVVLGMVARWDPVKDHATLLRALARLRQRGAVLRCVLVGTGMTPGNAALTELLCRLGIEDDVLLAGPREDIPAVMNALDLHVLSSAGEAFPNVVAEAMACGTPCVATNVGDTALIVGDAGWVVPRQSAVALADGIEGALAAFDSRDRVLLSRTCRRRIQENFSLEKMVGAYLALWEQVTLRDDLRG